MENDPRWPPPPPPVWNFPYLIFFLNPSLISKFLNKITTIQYLVDIIIRDHDHFWNWPVMFSSCHQMIQSYSCGLVSSTRDKTKVKMESVFKMLGWPIKTLTILIPWHPNMLQIKIINFQSKQYRTLDKKKHEIWSYYSTKCQYQAANQELRIYTRA